MLNRLSESYRVLLIVAAGLLAFCLPVSAAQKAPIRFDAYHGYTGATAYLENVAKAYPGITRLIEIGRSTLGRPIQVLVVTNTGTGDTIDRNVPLRNMRKEGVRNVPPMQPHQGKPGHWICGATHGNEFTGTEVCLYIIDQLVSGYGTDEALTRLIDRAVFYICPMVNPDGVFNSVEKGIPQRYNSRKHDDDGDGRINEDGPDDLNGDGIITQFRYKDPEGNWVVDDQDPRLMLRLRRDQKTDKPRYSVISEDRDNDGDGRRGEDSEAGIDLNRNFPEGWFKTDGFAGGSGDFPTSAPETHAVAEFFTNHTNILMAQNYHTSGGFTYRPLGTAPHSKLHPRDVAVLDFVMGKKYLELIGEEVPEAWQKPGQLARFKADLEKTSKNKSAVQRGYVLPRGWRVSYNEALDRRYSYGMATDWMYLQFGVFAVTTELWNPARDIPGLEAYKDGDDRLAVQRAQLKYQDEKHGGKLFLPWKAFRHPELGEGEIGGWLPNLRNNAFPGEPLLDVCEKHWAFERFRAELLPEVVIKDIKVRVLQASGAAADAAAEVRGDTAYIKKGRSKGGIKLVEVTAVIENRGPLATHVARGSTLPGNRPDVVWLVGEPGRVRFLQGTPFQKLGVLEGTLAIPGYKSEGAPAATPVIRRRSPYPPGYPQPRTRQTRRGPTEVKGKGSSRTVRWVVSVEGNAPLKVVVASQKGGTRVKSVPVK